MKLGIDATSLRQGGSRTHLVETLRCVRPLDYGFSKVVVWGSKSTLCLLDEQKWLLKRNPMAQEKGFLRRTIWQRFMLPKEVIAEGCDILFVPGGSYAGNFYPFVTMSRNMLPFEWKQLIRYGWTVMTLRLILLRYIQSRTFLRANGVIFLTQYARKKVQYVTGSLTGCVVTIPHGVNGRFTQPPRASLPITQYFELCPFRIVYVSTIDQYKHQWHVVEAVGQIRKRTGWALALDLVGSSYKPALYRLNNTIEYWKSDNAWVSYHGEIPYNELHKIYQRANIGLFASSCENMPNILLETMAAGLPIACSNRGPMPEVLRDAGVYFDPEQPEDIVRVLRGFILSPALRAEKAEASYSAALSFDWERCADDTFNFLAKVAIDYRRKIAQCAE